MVWTWVILGIFAAFAAVGLWPVVLSFTRKDLPTNVRVLLGSLGALVTLPFVYMALTSLYTATCRPAFACFYAFA